MALTPVPYALDVGRLGEARSLPPFAALRAFEAVGRLGGIRKAALVLQVDHAVVSRHLRALEAWTGVPLLDRTTVGGALTPEGLAYHQRISAAIAEMIAATHQVTRRDETHPLTIWCIPGFAFQWLSDQLAAFALAHPNFDFELRPTDEAADLARYEADADIRFYGDAWSTVPEGRALRSVELARPPVMVVASPEFAAGVSRDAPIEHLLQLPLLHEEHDEQWRAWFRANGVEPPARIPGLRMWHAHVAIAAARRGQGVALANPFLAATDLASGALVELKLADSQSAVIGAYVFLARDDRWRTPAMAGLRRWLQRAAISVQADSDDPAADRRQA